MGTDQNVPLSVFIREIRGEGSKLIRITKHQHPSSSEAPSFKLQLLLGD
jgi:hypothetical protein